MIHSRYEYLKARHEWVGLVIRTDADGTQHILDIGFEAHQGDIIAWCETAVRLYNSSPGPWSIPDMYDRRQLQ